MTPYQRIICLSANAAYLQDTLNNDSLQIVEDEAALQSALAASPAGLIILDSVTVCERIHETVPPSMPILMLVDPDEVQAALDAGATDCVLMPAVPALLQRRVDSLLCHAEHTILRHIQDTIMVVDADGRCVHIPNPDSAGMLHSPEQVIGQTLYDFLVPDQADKVHGAIKRVLKTGSPEQVEYALPFNGQDIWFSANLSRLSDEHIVWIKRNMTRRHDSEIALRESEKRYRQLFEAANDAILLIDIKTGRIRNANPQALRMLGYEAGEMQDMHISDVEIPPDSKSTRRIYEVDDKHLITRAKYRRHDGSTLAVETSSGVIQYEDRPTILCFARDISKRQKALEAEQDQRRLAEALRDTAAAFNSTLEISDVLDTILHNVGRVVPADSANIMLIDDAGVARIVRHRGYEKRGVSEDVVRSVRHIVEDVENLQEIAVTQQPMVISNVKAPGAYWKADSRFDWIQSYAGAPVIHKNETIGFINLDSSRPGHFSQEQAERLLAFANQAAIAIENARLFEQIQQHARDLEQRVEARTAELVKINEALRAEIQQREQAEARLEEERSLLHTIIDHIPDAIFVKDTDGRVIQGNRAALTITELDTFKDAIGKTNQELFPPGHPALQEHERELALMQSGEIQLNQELAYQSRSGNRRWMLATRVPLRDSKGEVIGMVGINRDVTGLKRTEKKLEDERNLLRSLIDTIPDRIDVKDTKGRYILVNQAVVDAINEESTESMVGRHASVYLSPHRVERYLQLEAAVLQGNPLINRQMSVTHADGHEHHYLVTKIPLRDSTGTITGLINISRDITDLSRTEQKLNQVLMSARCLLWTATVTRDDEGVYQWQVEVANETAARSFLPLSLDDADSYTEAWLNSILPEDRKRCEYVFQTHAEFNMHTYSLEFRSQAQNGDIHWLMDEVQIQPAGDDTWELVGVCTDITERKHAEQALQQINERLEQRVQERTRELLQTNDDLTQEVQERKRAEQAERHQRRLAEALRDSVAMLNQRLERDAVFDYLLEAIQPVVPYDAGIIILLNDDHIHTVRSRGRELPITGDPHPLDKWPELRDVLESNEPHLIHDTRSFEGWQGNEGSEWIRSNITVPITLQDSVIGFMKLYGSQVGGFDEQHADWLRAFANQAGIAIRNARLMEEIRQYTVTLEDRVDERTAELTYERAQLQAILDAMRDGVVFEDLDGNPQYINRAMTSITGYGALEWLNGDVGAQMNMKSPTETQQYWRKINRSLTMQGYWEGESELRHRDGHIFDAAVVRTEVRNSDGQRIGIVTVLRDISQAKQLEQQKARFIASASHELRTPIANIKTRLYLLRRRPEKLKENIDIIDSVVTWMQNLVENMFDVSRFERGVIPLEREDIPLKDFIDTIVKYQTPEAERLQISLRTRYPSHPITLYADPFRLTQVISNLLSNALNHTPQNGQIEVRIEEDNDEDIIRICVEDSGAGIPEADLPHLFQPFFQGDGNRNPHGAGLGLSIASEIVRLHGGEINVESKPGEGSTFIINLPVMSPEDDRALESFSLL